MKQVNKVAGSLGIKLQIYFFQIWAACKGHTPVQCPGLLPQSIQIVFDGDDPLMLTVITLMRRNELVLVVSFKCIAKYFNINKTPNQFIRYRISVGTVTDCCVFIYPQLYTIGTCQWLFVCLLYTSPSPRD